MPNWPLKLTTTDPARKVRWSVMEEDAQSRALGFVCACAGKHTLHTLSSIHTQEPTCYHHSLGAKGFNTCVLEGTDAALALPFWNSVSSENGEMTPQVFSILCAVCAVSSSLGCSFSEYPLSVLTSLQTSGNREPHGAMAQPF